MEFYLPKPELGKEGKGMVPVKRKSRSENGFLNFGNIIVTS